MGNILFYYDNACGENSRGGTEAATFRIAKALAESGKWKPFNAFRNKPDNQDPGIYEDVIKLGKNRKKFKENLASFIQRNQIDVVVNMSRFFRHNLLKGAITKSGRNTKLIFMQHFAPGSEKIKSSYSSGLHLLKLDRANPLYWLRASVYPLLKLPRTLRWKEIYRSVYENSDKVVLLSEGYFNEYADIGGISHRRKFEAIPNIFDSPSVKDALPSKKKRVLVLSRMDEIQKRLSLTLKIWQKIEARDDLNEWQLDIVGTGHDMKAIKKLARSLSLKNVVFHGWQQSMPFLRDSSIFMMTSLYEGLSLAMLEARAYGCVPIAYDSYASLKDVVEDGENGIVVKNFGDIEEYAEKLINLMQDREARERMAKSGMENMSRFSSEKIAERWEIMLDEIRNDNGKS